MTRFYDHYCLTIVVLLLSISCSCMGFHLFVQLARFWSKTTRIIESQIPELLSLLIIPSTYNLGIELLKGITPYKYFIPLIQELVARQRQSGVSLRQSFEELRRAIHLDLQFENEQRNFIKQSCGQFFSYILLTWGMCAFFAYAGLKLNLHLYILVFIFHLLGIVLIFFIVHKQQAKLEKIFLSFVPLLYQVMMVNEINLNLVQDFQKGPKEIERLFVNLKSLVIKRNLYGISISPELNLLAQEFWFTWELYWKKIKIQIERTKFALMMLIFGGAYMVILYGISSNVASSIFN